MSTKENSQKSNCATPFCFNAHEDYLSSPFSLSYCSCCAKKLNQKNKEISSLQKYTSSYSIFSLAE